MPSSSVRLLLLAALLHVPVPAPLAGQDGSPAAPLVLRAGDAVRLEVRDEPGLSGDFQVDEVGRVLLPLVGLVAVAGRDFEAVRAEVADGYARELSDPVLRVTPVLRIAVLGEVREPGLYPVDPTHALADVLALAGGFAPEADRDRVTLVRDGRVVAGPAGLASAELARALRSGDQVVVERVSWIRQNGNTLLGVAGSLAVALVTTLLLR